MKTSGENRGEIINSDSQGTTMESSRNVDREAVFVGHLLSDHPNADFEETEYAFFEHDLVDEERLKPLLTPANKQLLRQQNIQPRTLSTLEQYLAAVERVVARQNVRLKTIQPNIKRLFTGIMIIDAVVIALILAHVLSIFYFAIPVGLPILVFGLCKLYLVLLTKRDMRQAMQEVREREQHDNTTVWDMRQATQDVREQEQHALRDSTMVSPTILGSMQMQNMHSIEDAKKIIPPPSLEEEKETPINSAKGQNNDTSLSLRRPSGPLVLYGGNGDGVEMSTISNNTNDGDNSTIPLLDGDRNKSTLTDVDTDADATVPNPPGVS